MTVQQPEASALPASMYHCLMAGAELVQVQWVLGGLSAEELVGWALSSLEKDFTGLALQQLAGLVRPTLADLGTLPERASADAGLPPITREQAVTFLVEHSEMFTGPLLLSIVKSFPTFSERWKAHLERWRGKPAGSYNDMAEFVHFVVEDLYEKGETAEVRSVFESMEQRLREGDQEVRNLIVLGFFEKLQCYASWRPCGDAVFEQFLGPESTKAWREIQRTGEGKSSLAEVIRAERERQRTS